MSGTRELRAQLEVAQEQVRQLEGGAPDEALVQVRREVEEKTRQLARLEEEHRFFEAEVRDELLALRQRQAQRPPRVRLPAPVLLGAFVGLLASRLGSTSSTLAALLVGGGLALTAGVWAYRRAQRRAAFRRALRLLE